MLPQTELILAAVAKALDAKASAHPYYIRQPMRFVATALTNLKEIDNGSSNNLRSRADVRFRP